jgi:hypothetical protein
MSILSSGSARIFSISGGIAASSARAGWPGIQEPQAKTARQKPAAQFRKTGLDRRDFAALRGK